ncbi:MAG: 1-deoxy-D-xylulose-5-phosphate reductoisomerase [Alphaproteobacteria bacterium]|nr:1-deoxy-D-xylulose-5-phosphate reductoisomerase [Alphaproteobacteria bacterium]
MTHAHTRTEAAPALRRITVLGATGSVGRSTLDLVGRNPRMFAVEALTAWRDVAGLAELAIRFRPRLAVVADAGRLADLRAALTGTGIASAAGAEAVVEAASRPAELVMAAIVGSAGLAPTLAAIRRGAIVALANKECLVSAGDTMLAEVRRCGATLLPVDSEHNAIFQVFDAAQPESVEKLILTASGGPFRTFSRAQMACVTPAQAVAHPNWSMGAKISVDSATMMNKGLELIEAARLFSVPADAIEILVHPQSVVHSMVAYVDGSVLAQLGAPDMRTPIAHALAWPRRMATPAPRLDLASIRNLSFEAPDTERFPALRLAREVLAAGHGAPAVLNAANEVAVAGFLAGRIGFLEIAAIAEATLDALGAPAVDDLAAVFDVDAAARRHADGLVAGAG